MFSKYNLDKDFWDKIHLVIVNKICGLDIDDQMV